LGRNEEKKNCDKVDHRTLKKKLMKNEKSERKERRILLPPRVLLKREKIS